VCTGRRSVNEEFVPIFKDFQSALLKSRPVDDKVQTGGVRHTCSSAAASGDFKLGSVCADLKSDPEQDVYRFAREHFERLAWPELYANDNWWKKMSDEDLLIFLTELFVAAGVCSRCTTTATTTTTTTTPTTPTTATAAAAAAAAAAA